MGWKDTMVERFVMGADLPGESMPGQTLVELAGDGRVLVENHCGVIAYGSSEICVKVRYGVLSVRGSGLKLARMTKEQLVIIGRIDCVSIHRGRS